MYATLKTARDALETAADKILADYQMWVAGDMEARPLYGQIAAYDAVNAAVRECEDALRTAPTVAAQQCGLDEKALEEFRKALELPRWYGDDELLSAIRAYLTSATPPDVAGLAELLERQATGHDDLRSNTPNSLLRQAATALRLSAGGGWRDIASAPKDGTEVLVYAPPYAGLGDIICKAAWHDDAGWCVDELRTVTHWQPLPLPPASPTVEAGHVE